MMEILSESEADVLAVKITGELAQEDYEKLEPELQMRSERTGDFAMLVEFSDVEGLDPAAIGENLRFTKEFGGDIARMALVTDEPIWQGLSDFIGKPVGQFLGMEVERFGDRVEAWKWLQS